MRVGREVEGNAVLRVAQERFSRRLRCEHTRLSFNAELKLEAAGTGEEADDGFREVDVEIVADDVPLRGGSGSAEQAAEKPRKILFGPAFADNAINLSGADVESGDQGLSAMALVFELAAFDLARHHRQARRNALQCLNAGHFIDGDRPVSVIGVGCGLVNRTDVRAFAVKGRIRLWGQPVTNTMRLEVCLFFKKRPTERCEMFGTRPRRMASSAISRWLHWLIGRSLSDGFSHVIATTAQICSGVYVGGAPDRGASASRSQTEHLSSACRHRLRQYRAVLGQTPSSRALSRTPIPSAACMIMRARSTSCCAVEWVRTSFSSASRCSGKTLTGSALSKGIVTSCPRPRFVLPQHRVIRLHKSSNPSGVTTSARVY